MNINQQQSNSDIEASLADLIRTRPNRNLTGFAPGGKVSTHLYGSNRSLFNGRGMEFDETRIYQPGDDVKTIDWRVTARTGTVHTKLFHEERERPVFVLLDCRTMMHYGTRVRFKSVMAAHIAAILCWVGIDGGDRVGGFLSARDGLRDFAATRTRKGVLGFLKAMSHATCTPINPAVQTNTSEVPLHIAIRRLRLVCHPGALVFVISDFNDFEDEADTELTRLSKFTHVTNILIYDQLDKQLPPSGDRRFSDGEAVVSLKNLSRTCIQQHQIDFAKRLERLNTLSCQHNMALHVLPTSDNPKSILHPHLSCNNRLAQRRKTA